MGSGPTRSRRRRMDPPVAETPTGAGKAAPVAKSEYCPGCPVPHPFLVIGADGPVYTHDVREDGNLTCILCSSARPCRGTIVAGKSGHAFRTARDIRDNDRPKYRGLKYDGNLLR